MTDGAAAIGLDEPSPVTRATAVRKLLRAKGAGLAAVDPRSTPGLAAHPADPKEWSRLEVARLGVSLATEQEKLYAAATGVDRRRVLLVLQAMDGGGKDGTIRAVVGRMNPLGVRITAFRAPTPAELAHDFLWR